MTRARAGITVAMTVIALIAIVVVAAGGGGSEGPSATRATTPALSGTPRESAVSPNLEAFPRAFVQCLADQGIDVDSITSESLVDVVHSPEGNACFGVLHQGGGAP
jgi:hypothetical protein